MTMRVVPRSEGEEEITPPYVSKTRSFDALSVAHMLQSQMNQEQLLVSTGREVSEGFVEEADSLKACDWRSGTSSPTVAEAAEGLLNVQQQNRTESAVDCLMSLSAIASSERDEASKHQEAVACETSKKRFSQEQLHAARRRLKLRTGGAPSPLTRPRPPPKLHPLSGASVQQLRWLAAAYKMCPVPTPEQVDAISERIQIPADAIGAWFQSRKMLQDWVHQQPNMSRSALQGLFYTSVTPSCGIPNGA